MFVENENIYIYIQGFFNLISSFGIFGPQKIFYGQNVAHIYIGKKEAILENAHAKNCKKIPIFRN